LGISVDGAWCHEAFVKDRRLHFPLLADFHPKGEVVKNYGAYREQDGVCERALFVVDRKRMIFWSIAHQLPSIRALTESSLLWTGYQTIEKATMVTLKVPITQRDHMRGPANATVTLVEYGDYECPHCGLAHPIVDMVQKHFAKHLNFVFRHFPLSQIHPTPSLPPRAPNSPGRTIGSGRCTTKFLKTRSAWVCLCCLPWRRGSIFLYPVYAMLY
jgi:hypothetical protein